MDGPDDRQNVNDSRGQEAVLPISSSGAIEVRSTPYTNEDVARGLFATVRIPRGTLIERAHCIRFSPEEHDEHAMKTPLQHYTFRVGSGSEHFLALGLGSLFNHADPPNVEFRIRRKDHFIDYIACRDINIGEELFIYYGRNLWFNCGTDDSDGLQQAAVDQQDNNDTGLPLPFCGDEELP